jgi:hypothetical protein
LASSLLVCARAELEPQMAEAPAVSALQFRAISNAGSSSAAPARSIATAGTMAASAKNSGSQIVIFPSPGTERKECLELSAIIIAKNPMLW